MRNLKENPLKLGIIGGGSFIQRRILPALKNVDTLQLVAIQTSSLKGFFEKIYCERQELLTDSHIEAVFIASRNYRHEEDAIACAQAKKTTLCEKPLAPTVEGVKNILNAFAENSTKIFVGHSLRFKPAVQIAKKMVQEGTLGTLLSVRIHFSIPVPKENWRYEKKFGGGVLQDIGVHLVDLIHFITDERVVSVYALGSGDEVDESVVVLAELSKGTTVTLECSFKQPFHSGFELIGSASRLQSLNSLRQTFDPIETLCHIREDDSKIFFPLKAVDVYEQELAHFAQAATHLQPSIISAEISLSNQIVIEAILQSLQTKNKISLPSSPSDKTPNQGNNKNYHEDPEKNFCNGSRACSNSTKTKNSGDDCNNEKN